MNASRYHRFPVNKTGVYKNKERNRLEYWFFWKNRSCKIGECSLDMPQSVRDAWEQRTSDELVEELSRKVCDGAIRVDVAEVRRQLKR